MRYCTVCQTNTDYKINIKILGSDSLCHQLIECSNCGHVSTLVNSKTSFDTLYEDENYKIRDTRNSIYERIQNIEYSRVISIIEKSIHKQSNILDFGSGKGVFLNLLKSKGYENLIGIETSLPRANFAKEKYKLNILTDFYTGGMIGRNGFDVITLFHVLEHIEKPYSLINNLITNLNINGHLVVEVPNLRSWQSHISKNNWLHLDVPRHLHHFKIDELTNFFKNHENVTIVKVQTFSLHLGIIGMMQSIFNLFGYKGFLIKDLKDKNKQVICASVFFLPLALSVELLATLFKRGGIVRIIFRKIK